MTTQQIWPAPGKLVAKAPGLYYLAGETVVVTRAVQRLLDAGDLLSYDPGSPTPPGPFISGGSATQGMFATELGTLVGSYDGQLAHPSGRSAHGDAHFPPLSWVPGSTTPANGGSIFGTTLLGRWKLPKGIKLNALWFGCVAGGAGDGAVAAANMTAFANMLNVFSSNGGTAFIPTGVYDVIGFVAIPGQSNVTIHGEGAGTIFRRIDGVPVGTSPTGKEIFNFDGKTHWRVHSMRLEYSKYVNFENFIHADDASFHEVDHCEFEMLEHGSIVTGDQLTSLLNRRGQGLSYHDNKHWYVQSKLEGVSGGKQAQIHHNYYYKPYNGAVSVVGTVFNGASIRNIHVHHNIVEEPQSEFAFFIGGDGETLPPTILDSVIIEDNEVYGTLSTAQGVGILMDLGITTRDIIITNNILRMTDGATPANATFGILIKSKIPATSPAATFDNISISGNHVYGVDQDSIGVQGTGVGLQILGNVCANGRGIVVHATTGGMRDVLVAHNVVPSSIVQGIKIWAAEGNITDFKAVNNIVGNVTGAGVFDAGINIFCEDGRSISGTVESNRCTDTLLSVQEYGIREYWTAPTDPPNAYQSTGTGTFAVEYINNNCVGCTVRGYNLTATAVGRGNRGTGFTTRARGIVDVANGSSSITITHGLSHRSSLDAELASATGINVSVHLVRPTTGDAVVTASVAAADISSTQVVVRFSGATPADHYKLHWTATLAEHLE